MGRLQPEFITRVDDFSHRVMDVVEVLVGLRTSHRIMDQLTGSATSVGANVCEADEAMSTKDFVRALGIALKELNETRFWLRFVARRNWIEPIRLAPLQSEAEELKKILGTLIARNRPTSN